MRAINWSTILMGVFNSSVFLLNVFERCWTAYIKGSYESPFIISETHKSRATYSESSSFVPFLFFFCSGFSITEDWSTSLFFLPV